MRRARSVDTNQREITHYLEKYGVCVIDFAGAGDGCPDIAVYYRGVIGFLEIKFGKDARLKRTQAIWLGKWKGHAAIARSPEEALAIIKGAIPWLTQAQKDKLAVYAAQMSKEVRLTTAAKVCGLWSDDE